MAACHNVVRAFTRILSAGYLRLFGLTTVTSPSLSYFLIVPSVREMYLSMPSLRSLYSLMDFALSSRPE